MKILIFNRKDITHPRGGGAEVYTHEIGKRLVKLGNEVTIFCGSYPKAKKREVIDGIKIMRVGTDYNVYLYAFKAYLSSLKGKYDIVIDEINAIPFFTPLYVKEPKIALIHQMVKEIFYVELPFRTAIVGRLAEKLIPYFYSNMNFVTVSPSTKKDLIYDGIPEENISIVYNGLCHKKYLPGRKSNFPNILYLGRLEKYKGVDTLIKSFQHVISEYPEARLNIAGYGNAELYLKDIVKRLKLDNYVNILGHVTEKEKAELLQKAWIFVAPSIREGWGLSLMEANACGTPGIAFYVPGLKDSIRNNKTGILIKNRDETKLSDSIKKLIKDKNLRKTLSNNSINWSKKFDWDKTTEKFLDIIEKKVNE